MLKRNVFVASIFILATTIGCSDKKHRGITDPDAPVATSPAKNPKYKVGGALNIAPDNGSLFMSGWGSNGNGCFVDWTSVQFVIGSAPPLKMLRSQKAPPGFNRCRISPNARFGMFEDKENRAKLCSLSNSACISVAGTDDATRVLEIWLGDSTFVITDGVGGVIISKFASGGNMLSTPVVFAKFVSAYGRVVSVVAIEGGKYLAMATSNGCYDVRGNDGKYLTVGQVVCGQIAKSNQPAQFAWDDKTGRMYGLIDSGFLMFTSSNGQLTQLGVSHQFPGQVYMPTIIDGDMFINTAPGVVEMYTASNPEWGKAPEVFTFEDPNYYILGAIPCPGNPQNACLTGDQKVYPIIRTAQ